MSSPRRPTVAILGTGAVLALALVAARAPSRDASPASHPVAPPPATPVDAMGMRVAPIQLQSAGVMQFTPDGTLLLADPRAATIYAIDVADPLRDTTVTGVRVDNVDGKIAAALGTTRDQLRIIDMVAHPRSQTLYFSLTRGRGDQAVPLIVSVTKVEETVTVLPLDNIRHSSAQLADAPPVDKRTSWGQPMRQLSITDVALADGEVLVAGLSNEEFASTLRRLKYPFTTANAGVRSTTVEIFHTSHDRYETASPIESFLPITLNGKPSLVAGYGCSPIATFDRADFATTKHLRGKTIAELGGGNRPFDMIEYRNAAGKQYILIGNSDRTITRLDPTEVAGAPALVTAVKAAYEPAGVNYLAVASFGVMQLDDYNPAFVVVLQRNRDDGSLQVSSLTKRML